MGQTLEMELDQNQQLGIFLKSSRKYNAGDIVLKEKPFISWSVQDPVNPRFEFLEDTSLSIFTGFIQQLNNSNIEYLLNNYCYIDHDSHIDLVNAKLGSYVEIAKKLALMFDLEWKVVFNVLTVPMLNGHTVDDSCGLFDSGSKFTHDCDPNCVVTSNGNNIQFTAIRGVEEGEILTCSYLSGEQLLMPTILRQYSLLMKKSFICKCKRCCNLDEQRTIPCECGGLVHKASGAELFLDLINLYNFQFPANNDWICSSCHSVTEINNSDLDILQKLYTDDLEEQDIFELKTWVDEYPSPTSWMLFKFLQIGFELYMEEIEEIDEQAEEYCEMLLQWLMDSSSVAVLTNLGMGYAEMLLERNPQLTKKYIRKCLPSATYMWGEQDDDVQWMITNQ
jgi:phage gp46-like protein